MFRSSSICFSSRCVKYRLNSVSKHPTAAWAYDMQTTAHSWIKEASVAPARFWWMTIVIKVKTIIVAYRSRALACTHLFVIIDVQTNRVCTFLAHLKHGTSAWTQFSIFPLLSKFMYSKIFYNRCSPCVSEKCEDQWCLCSYAYQTLQKSGCWLMVSSRLQIAEFPHI